MNDTFRPCFCFRGVCCPAKARMNDFKASVVAYEVQKSFANKFFSNKTVVKSLIDDTSGKLLDNLYLLLKTYVRMQRFIHLEHFSWYRFIASK